MSPGGGMDRRPGGTFICAHLHRMATRTLCLALLALSCGPAAAFTVAITAAAPKTVYLQIGVGSFTGLYNNGGTPQNNTTVASARFSRA